MNRRSLFKAGLPLAAILILAAGCADHSPTAVELDPASLGANRSATVVKGSGPAVVSYHHEAGSYSAMITHRGGTLDFGIGSITFPAGALKEPARITAVTDGENLGAVFGPHGLEFPQPVEVTFRSSSPIPADAFVIYVSEAGEVLETISGTISADRRSIKFLTDHFSGFQLATNRS
jgi:hypothetical protein